jgi:ketosteroid isomerase-like protein
MKVTISALAALLLLLISNTQADEESADREKAELARIVEKLFEAFTEPVQLDVARKHLTDDALITDPAGYAATLAEHLKDIKSGDLKIISAKTSEMRFLVRGEVAVVNLLAVLSLQVEGREIPAMPTRWTIVFRREGGQWKGIASHGTPIQQPTQ